MATRSDYADIVRRLMRHYATFVPSHGDIQNELIIDEAQGHYELIHLGWDGQRRVHGILIHIDLIGDKVWIQHDGTAHIVAEDLVDEGIPKQDIVLGFRPAQVRELTGYGVG